MMNFTPEDDAAVKWCEEKYPELTQEYKKIMIEQYVLFCKKHRNYGPSNINVGTTYNAGGFFFNGNIGPYHIYNRALSSTEVLHNYNALKGRFGL